MNLENKIIKNGGKNMKNKKMNETRDGEGRLCLSGKVLIYSPEGILEHALRQSMELVYRPCDIIVSSRPFTELERGEYDLVINASDLRCGTRILQRTIEEYVEKALIDKKPEVVQVNDLTNVTVDIVKVIEEHFGKGAP